MPTYDDRKRSIFNCYGLFSLWSAILLFASYWVLYTSGCEEIANIDIQLIIAISSSFGFLLFLFSLFNIAINLFHRKFVFYWIVFCIVLVAISLLYASYQTLILQCQTGRYYERNFSIIKNLTKNPSSNLESSKHSDILEETFRNIQGRRSTHYIASSFLDLIAGLFFMVTAYTFRNRL